MSKRILHAIPLCAICHKPVALEGSNTDTNGVAVHEECYVRKVAERKPPNPERKAEMRWGQRMVKTVYCVNRGCGRCINVEGSTEGLREISFLITCPYCEASNQMRWPMAGDFTVGRGDEIPR
jgi:hypothetical protein